MKNKPKIRKLWHGAAYYPEVWHFSEKVVEEDIRYMKEGGFNLMRMAEFAWSAMESREGCFELDEFHKVMDRLYENGIYTIMCTPSATPPSWLTLRNEETLQMTDEGRRFQHGSRRHGCSNSPLFRGYVMRICEKMAKRFGSHPGVIGWQIDNEIYPNIRDVNGAADRGCCCPICLEKFHRRLEDKFKTVEQLNKAWSLRLWSQEYCSFDEVQHPHMRTWSHPSLITEWNNFRSDSNAEFVRLQAETLRENGVAAPIGTDMMPMGGQSYPDTNRALDVVQFNHYHGKDNLWEACFWYDYIRGIIPGAPFWNTETGMSYTGGASAYGYGPKGFNIVNSLLPYALGGEANCYWLWRAHPAGQELMNGGVITSQGRPQYNFGECAEISGYLKGAEKFLLGTTVKNTGFAMTYSCKTWNMFEGQAISWGLDYQAQMNAAYGALLRANMRPWVIGEEADLNLYKVIYSPFMPCIDECGFGSRLAEWIESGGIWIAGPLTDIRDACGAKHGQNPTGRIEQLTGAYLKYAVPAITFPAPAEIRWDIPGAHSTAEKAQVWADGYETPENCERLGVYAEGELKGLAAAFFAPIGSDGGGIVALGTKPSDKTLAEIASFAFLRKGLKKGPETSPNALAVERISADGSEAGIIALEMGFAEGYVVLPRPMKNIITGEPLSGRVELNAYAALFLE